MSWFIAIEQDQKLIQKLEGQCPQAMLQAKKGRQERRKVRHKAQAQLVHDIVLKVLWQKYTFLQILIKLQKLILH